MLRRSLGTELSGLEERIANTDSGAVTSIQAVYVTADDFTDSAAVHTFSYLSASIVQSPSAGRKAPIRPKREPCSDPCHAGKDLLLQFLSLSI